MASARLPSETRIRSLLSHFRLFSLPLGPTSSRDRLSFSQKLAPVYWLTLNAESQGSESRQATRREGGGGSPAGVPSSRSSEAAPSSTVFPPLGSPCLPGSVLTGRKTGIHS